MHMMIHYFSSKRKELPKVTHQYTAKPCYKSWWSSKQILPTYSSHKVEKSKYERQSKLTAMVLTWPLDGTK
jgi:hypothetical protein